MAITLRGACVKEERDGQKGEIERLEGGREEMEGRGRLKIELQCGQQ